MDDMQVLTCVSMDSAVTALVFRLPGECGEPTTDLRGPTLVILAAMVAM
jgi:hypothetical protein